MTAAATAFIVDHVERAIGNGAVNVEDQCAGTCRHRSDDIAEAVGEDQERGGATPIY
jgi:hypothetical protein